jgi:hypothetical protein
VIIITIILALFLTFSQPVFAEIPTATPSATIAPTSIPTPTPTLSATISSLNPTSGIVGNPFQVNLNITNGGVGTTYYFKIFGGIDSNNDAIKTAKANTYLPYTGHSWNEYPFFVINTDGSATASVNAMVDPSKSSTGTYNLHIRLAKLNSSSSYDISDYDTKTISMIAPSPTPTAAPTNTPTPTPTPTKIPTITPTPTTEPTPYLEPTLADIPTVAQNSEVSGTTSPTPTPSITKKSKNIIPGLFIGLGCLLLLTPLIIIKIQTKKKNK